MKLIKRIGLLLFAFFMTITISSCGSKNLNDNNSNDNIENTENGGDSDTNDTTNPEINGDSNDENESENLENETGNGDSKQPEIEEDNDENNSSNNEDDNQDLSGNISTQGEVQILKSAGHLESLYVEWAFIDNVEDYNVYYKKESDSIMLYTKVDSMLIRQYSEYYRVDVLGLISGDYEVKIAPVVNGEERNFSTTKMAVISHDRSGYAFQTGNDFSQKVVPGAYNMDGSLKDNARVLYVTQNNFNSVELEVHTSATATEVKVGVQSILSAYEKGYETQPLAIRLIGQINATNLTLAGENGTLQLKGKGTTNFNVTIEGVGTDTTMYGWGLLIVKANAVEIRNLGTMLFKDDGISLKESKNIWVHNCDIFYGGTGSDSDQAKGDGSLDLKDDSQNITLSYIHFWDSGKMSLCGMKSESGENWITYHHNWFDHSDSRHPRVRTMTVHVYNNYYDGVAKYGVGATMGSSVFVENNYFYNTSTPMMSSMQGTDALGEGTFSGEAGGLIKAYGNVMYNDNEAITTRYITYQENNTSFDAYEAKSRDEQISTEVVTLSGRTTYNNFDTASTFYSYNLETAEQAVETVKKFAGRVDGGDFTWDFSDLKEDTNYAVNTELKQALIDYTSKLVKILGDDTFVGNTSDKTNTETEGDSDDSNINDDNNSSSIEGALLHNFTESSLNSSFITFVGTTSTNKGPVTYNDLTLTTSLKMNSSASFTFKNSTATTMTLVFRTTDSGNTIYINDEYYTIDSTGILVIQLQQDTNYTIKRKSGESHLFYIEIA